jgi:hypothetical protein
MKFVKSYWTHLARGALERGFTVVMAGYTLCPEVSIAQITEQIVTLANHLARRFELPMFMTGHSAGGHLVSRLCCTDVPLDKQARNSIVHTLSISGVHDLRPILRTQMNDTLGLTPALASAESPALQTPGDNTRLTCWVGEDELAEFVRQSELLANIWYGLGTDTNCVVQPERNHFTIIEDLADPESSLIRTLLCID